MIAAAQAPLAAIEGIEICKTNSALAPEFLLTAACCRWPASQTRAAAVRDAAKNVTDWDRFLAVVQRHRVIVLAYNALRAAGIALPPAVAKELESRAQRIIHRSLNSAAETARLQNLITVAGTPVVVLKGVALEQLAYASLSTKQTRDIDLLVPPDCAGEALQILERDGYTLSLPARKLSAMQRQALICYGREVELIDMRRKLRVELQWRAADNPLLLKGIDAHAKTQKVMLSERAAVRTLAPDDLFAFLCVHGARHSWSRLKWLADLNALIASRNLEIEHVYRHAQNIGAGLCAAQALSLCERLMGLKLPSNLAREFDADKRCRRLIAIAMRAMMTPYAADGDAGTGGVARELRNQFLLGRGLRFYTAQCLLASAGTADIVRLPLPRPLHFIYPLVRVPLWLWRRMKLACLPPRLHAG